MVQNMIVIQGDIILDNDLNQNSVSFVYMSNAYLNCVASLKSLHRILQEELRRREQDAVVLQSNTKSPTGVYRPFIK